MNTDRAISITGKLIEIRPIKTGVSDKGEWAYHEILIKTHENVDPIALQLRGDRINRLMPKLYVGLEAEYKMTIRSTKSKNELYYTTLQVFNVVPL